MADWTEIIASEKGAAKTLQDRAALLKGSLEIKSLKELWCSRGLNRVQAMPQSAVIPLSV